MVTSQYSKITESQWTPWTLLLVSALLAALGNPARADSLRSWQFQVLLDDDPIGSHRFEVSKTGTQSHLLSEANFDVEILFVSVYRYIHVSDERWMNGCLQAISSQTDDNGDSFRVEGLAENRQFRVVRNGETAQLPACVQTYAYWDPDALLSARRLLNAQTGKYDEVTIRKLGKSTLEVLDQTWETETYEIQTPDGPIRLWYTAKEGLWLALESITKGGDVLRYEPLELPEA